MTDKQLQLLVEEISWRYFLKPFSHRAVFNRRLKSTGGRYHLNTHHLDFNPLVLQNLGQDVFEAVIKHELCHYHLHLSGLGYKHADKDFKQLLKKVGGIRHVPHMQIGHQYKCQTCGQNIYRQRRFDVSKYVCRCCRGRLKLVHSE